MEVLVIGGGIMGRGIAFVVAATAQLPVTLVDTSAQALDDAVSYMKRIARRQKLDENLILSRVSRSTSLRDTLAKKPIGFVIEAVSEKLELKKSVFTDLVKYSGPDTILATNTSSLPITVIAETVEDKYRGRVIGMHFFNPVPRLPALEIIVSKYTSQATVDKTYELANAMQRKVALCRKDIAGFIVNRILNASFLEAANLLEQGISTPEEIDRIMINAAGHKMGPFKVMDMVGLDTAGAVGHVLYEQSGHDPRYRPSPLIDSMMKENKLGMKTGEGFYKYSKL